MINEYMPLQRRGTCIAVFLVSQNLAALTSMFSPLMLPANDDTAGLEANQTWRIILAIPGVFYFFQLAGFLTWHRLDSPSFYI